MPRDTFMMQPDLRRPQMSGAPSGHLVLIVSRPASGNVITSGLTVIFTKKKKKNWTANRCSMEFGGFFILMNSSASGDTIQARGAFVPGASRKNVP